MLKRIVQEAANGLGFRISRIAYEPPVSPAVTQLVHDMRPVTTDIALFRAGGDTDGAYLVPDDLDGITALFSPGVDIASQFEADMAERGMECYLADASVERPGIDHPRFHFERKFLGLADDGDFITLDHWVGRNQPGDSDLMLQMDIEGAEWLVLANMSDALLARFRVIVIELHDLAGLLNPFPARIIPDVLQRLLQTHHVVHNHPNNYGWIARRDNLELPDVIEVTFLRKDRADPTGLATQFPHPLDVHNSNDLPPMTLPACWHG